jgi:hypothetical protein
MNQMIDNLILPIDTEELTPGINFNTSGILSIEGKSYPENPIKFYTPVLDWLKNYKKQSLDYTEITLRLDYFNTSTGKVVMMILKILEDIHLQQKKMVQVKWLYNIKDEDMYESGLDFQSIIDLPFEFIGIES